MIFRRVLRYVIFALVIFAVLSVISLARNWGAVSAYFLNSLSSLLSVGLYFFIIGFGFWLLFRSLTR